MNKLTNPYPELAKGWFGSDNEAAIRYYAKRLGWGEGTKAQLQAVLDHLGSKEVRTQFTIAMGKCYSQELSACPKHPIFQPQKALNAILKIMKEGL